MKKKWWAVLGILAALGIISALLIYVFVYNKPQPDYSKKDADFELSAAVLFADFIGDPSGAAQKYNGKVLQVAGKLDGIDRNDSILIAVFAMQEGMFGDEGIRFAFIPEFNDRLLQMEPGEPVTIKGYCTGYNDTDVILEHCSLVQ